MLPGMTVTELISEIDRPTKLGRWWGTGYSRQQFVRFPNSSSSAQPAPLTGSSACFVVARSPRWQAALPMINHAACGWFLMEPGCAAISIASRQRPFCSS